MKEDDMVQPNNLGHYHRDIVACRQSATPRYYRVTMSCGHKKDISMASYYKYKGHATLCIRCEKPKEGSYVEDRTKLNEIVDDAFCRVRDEIGRPLNCDELRAMFDRVIYQGLRHLEGYDGQ